MLALVWVVLGAMAMPDQRARAAIQPCTEEGLDAAIAAGGLHIFDCGGATTISTSDTKIIRAPVTIDGKDDLTISGGGTHRVFEIEETGTLELRNLTISDGFDRVFDGGAIFNLGRLLVDNCLFENNRSPLGSGGAIANDVLGVVFINDSDLNNNEAYSGGAVYSRDGTVTLQAVGFENNVAETTGGALHNEMGAVVMFGAIMIGNSSRSGGAVYTAHGSLTADLSVFFENRAVVDGGAITSINAVASIQYSFILANEAGEAGSGIHNASGVMTVYRSAIFGNSGADYEVNHRGVGQVMADRNYWGAASGPSGAGPGTGAAISDKVLTPTWLEQLDDILNGLLDGIQFPRTPVSPSGR
jgi:hypothetical protein